MDETLDETVDETLDETVAETTAPAAAPEAPKAPEKEKAEPAEKPADPDPFRFRNDKPERLASDAELKELRRINADPRLKKIIRNWSIVGVVIAVLVGVYGWRSTRNEVEFTWPGAMDGKFDDGEVIFKYRGYNAFRIYYPNTPGMKVEADPEGLTADITTRIGRYLECPFHLQFSSATVTNWWQRTTDQTYEDFEDRMAGEGFEIFTQSKRVSFLNSRHGAGWPVIECDYIRYRSDLNSYWCGVCTYLRDLDREFVLLREVQVIHQVQAKELVRNDRCFKASVSLTANHYEVPEKLTPGDPAVILRDIRIDMMRDFANSSWPDIDNGLKTVLIKSRLAGDELMLKDVELLWRQYRAEQSIWYNRRRFSYMCADREGNEDEMRQIRTMSLKKFSKWDDARRRLIQRGIWRY